MIPILESSSQKYLLEFIKVNNVKFESVLKENYNENDTSACDIIMIQMFKGYIYHIYEIAYRRLEQEIIKSDLHKYLYGGSTQGNELTKFLISSCNAAKKQQFAGYKGVQTWLEVQEKQDEGSSNYFVGIKKVTAHSIQVFYSSSAYSCMCSVISKTQSKENVFTQYLFQVNRDKSELLWELLVDTEARITFEVETSFHVKPVEKERKVIKESGNLESNTMVKDETFAVYFTDSLFVEGNSTTTSTKTAPVKYEEMKDSNEKQKVKAQTEIAKKDSMAEKGPQLDSVANVLEGDTLNKQLIMPNLLRVLGIMESKFSADWQKAMPTMPAFMQALRYELMKESLPHINIRLFILKLLINKPTLFKPFAKEWFDPIMAYLLQCKEQGKGGFHYFARDLCTMILSWEYVPISDKTHIEICSSLVNNIIKVLPDKTSYIFYMNVRVLGAILERFANSSLIYLNKKLLIDMLSTPEKKDGADLWRVNALQILSFASNNNVPLCDTIEEYLALPAPRNFSISENDLIMKKLLDTLEYHKRSVNIAGADTLGRIMKRMKSKNIDVSVIDYLLVHLSGKNIPNLAMLTEKLVQNYPQILAERKLFIKLLALMQCLSGSFRRYILLAIST